MGLIEGLRASDILEKDFCIMEESQHLQEFKNNNIYELYELVNGKKVSFLICP